MLFAVTLAIITYINRACISQGEPLTGLDPRRLRVKTICALPASRIACVSFGISGGALGPLVLGNVLQKRGSWLLNSYVMAGIYSIAAIAWHSVDPVAPLKGAALDE